MAKDVDLTSKEWTNIVFEGKNKDFGAYTLRSTSPKRHTKAVLIVLCAIALIIIGLIVKIKADEIAAEEAKAQQELESVEVGGEDIADEPEDEMVQEIPEDIPEPEPVQEEEETTATQAITELKMVDVVDKEKEIKDQSEILEDTRVLGSENREGLEDLNKKAAIETVVEKAPEPEKPKDEGPVSMAMVAEKPQFPGGDKAMMKWLNDNINYPAQAAEEGAQGKVQVQFVVEKDGSVSNVKVLRGKHPALDEEAKRVVRKMPKWLPGRNNGVPVRVIYVLPVAFRLQN